MNNKVYDGMRYPSIDELLKVVDSKYKLAVVSAARAKIIEEEDGYTNLDNPLCKKSVGVALEEILADKTTVTFKNQNND